MSPQPFHATVVLAAMVLQAPPSFAADRAPEPLPARAFAGTLGDSEIKIRLTWWPDATISGDYLYAKHGELIHLAGTAAADDSFTVRALDWLGKTQELFIGSISSSDGSLSATWNGNGKTLRVAAVPIPLKEYQRGIWAWRTNLAALPVSPKISMELVYDIGSDGWASPVDQRVELRGQQYLVHPIAEQTPAGFLPPSPGYDGGPEASFPLFQAGGSHWYGGSIVHVSPDTQYVAEYVGFRGTGIEHLKWLSGRAALDFRQFGAITRPSRSWLTLLFDTLVPAARACGCGACAAPIGRSNLTFIKTVGAVRWYAFDTPIRLYRQMHMVCDADGTCDEQFEDGTVRMNFDFVPAEPGDLTIELAALVLAAPGRKHELMAAIAPIDPYRARLVQVESAAVRCLIDSSIPALVLEIRNDGAVPIRWDALARENLQYAARFEAGAIEKFLLLDRNRKPTDSVAWDEISRQLAGKTLAPGDTTRLPLFPLAGMEFGSSLVPMIQRADQRVRPRDPRSAGRIFRFSTPATEEPTAEILPHTRFLPIGDTYGIVTRDAGGVQAVALTRYAGRSSNRADEPFLVQLLPSDGLPFVAHARSSEVRTPLSSPIDSTDTFHWASATKATFKETVAALGPIEMLASGRDFYGRHFIEFRRGAMHGFVVDHHRLDTRKQVVQLTVVYEFSESWLDGARHEALLRWLAMAGVPKSAP